MSALEKIKQSISEEKLKKEQIEFHAKMRRLDAADAISKAEALVNQVFREFDGINGLVVADRSICFEHMNVCVLHTKINECRLGDKFWFALEIHQNLGFNRILLEDVTIEAIEDVVAKFMKSLFSDYDFEKNRKS